MPWFTRLLTSLCLLAFLSTGSLPAQTTGLPPRGLLVAKDPQTGYVEIFEYVVSKPVNALVTQYQLTGGLIRQVPKAAQVEEVRYPRSGTSPAPAAELANDLHQLDALAQRYPQYTSILASATARLRQIPVQAAPASTPVAPAPGTIPALVLRDGTRYQDATILHADGDRFTIRHQNGIAEVLIRDLPADPNSVSPAVQTLRKTYQEKLAKVEAERKRAELAAAARTTPSAKPVPPVVKTSASPSVPPSASPVLASSSPVPSAAPDASMPPVAPSKWRRSVLPGLTVKGLSIGMDATEASKVLLEQGQGRLSFGPTPVPGEHGFAVFLSSNGHRASGVIGRVSIDPADNTVTMFTFEPVLSNLLFNTADQSAEEFARTFMNAYDVPTLNPTAAGNAQFWSYTSAEGWTLHIYSDKAVSVLRTPERKFD